MTQLDIKDTNETLADLVARIRAGEEVVLTEDGKPVARLVPTDPPAKRSIIGLFKGKIQIADDFDAPLSDDEMREEWGL